MRITLYFNEKGKPTKINCLVDDEPDERKHKKIAKKLRKIKCPHIKQYTWKASYD